MLSSFDLIEQIHDEKGFVKLGLIDPDKKNDNKLLKIIQNIESSNFDGILIGGSSICDEKFEHRVNQIKSNSKLPLILFPGSSNQISKKIDSILFLNLISGRNPKYLIEEQVKGAMKIYQNKINAIPTAYILLDGGSPTEVSKVSNTTPISMNSTKSIIEHSLAGQYLGNKIIYLDCGSGAKNHIDSKLLNNLKTVIDIPIMVGGGIKNPNQIDTLINAGADYIVCSSMFE